jgi:hypothetical protein
MAHVARFRGVTEPIDLAGDGFVGAFGALCVGGTCELEDGEESRSARHRCQHKDC